MRMRDLNLRANFENPPSSKHFSACPFVLSGIGTPIFVFVIFKSVKLLLGQMSYIVTSFRHLVMLFEMNGSIVDYGSDNDQ